MDIAPALLEEWMRNYYFSTEIDIGSSGVENYSLGDLRTILRISQEDLDDIVLNDSSSYGNAALRETIARRWGNGNPEWIMVTHGSSEAIFLAMNTLLQAGDEVVTLDPCYHSLYSIAATIGCKLKLWKLSFMREPNADVAGLKSLINARTRMVVVNFPHNPTGITLTTQQQEKLIEAVAEVGAYLVWDGAFADLTYNTFPLPDPILRYSRAISIRTLSKAYGLPGLRFGWCSAAPSILANFVHLRDRVTLHLSPLIEFIALRVVEDAQRLLDIRLQQASTNLDILSKWVSMNHEHVEWIQPRPQGGVTAFPRLRYLQDTEAFCHDLARKQRVLLVPGTCFDNPHRVRIGFGGPTAEFEEGLSRLAGSLNSL